uniref:Galactokinase n=1 Tax=Clastoptera arizonana TaxID=38151 RepID=A0A1B6DN88_9HEMI
METSNNTADTILKVGITKFIDEFGHKPTVAGCGPGRVNLIGEHTDYNDGFVLPIALPMVTFVIGSKNKSKKCKVRILNKNVDKETFSEFNIPSVKELEPGSVQWTNYVKGVVSFFKGDIDEGFNAVILSNVPIGGGLSSSASLEVAVYSFLEELYGKTENLVDKALACQKAEHIFANVPCGIMDQFISIMGAENKALLIDCMNMTSELVPMESSDFVVLIINSNVKHNLAGGEYAKRRKECEEAAKLLNCKSLRFATIDQLKALKQSSQIDDVIFKRAHHVISEISRTTVGAKALANKDFKTFGKLMYQSHYSLRNEYEVSCKELDELVGIVKEVPGVLGSRMTGGGFGGCTITLVDKKAVDNVIRKVKEEYSGKPDFYIAVPAHGAKSFAI